MAGRPDAHDFQWLAAVCTVSAECAIYGGIAAGGHGAEEWPVAVMTIASVSLTETLVACRHGPLVRGQGEAGARGRGFWWVPDRLVAPSAGWRVLIAMVVLAAAGPGQALAAVFAVEAVSVCWVLVVVSFGLPTARFAAPAGIGVLARCRDDGPAARWAGRLVQGGLLPLQPAVAGLFATAMLAAIGLRSLPGFVAMTPPVVMMMLASPGSSHAHDGRADWLVPTLLAAAQYVYLAALGFADAVPGPVVFAACAVLALWQASLAAGGPPLTAAGIGWEGRMFGIGFAAIFGFATFGYIGQAAFLGLLTCQNILGRYLVPKEEGHARGGVLPPGPHRDHRRGDSRGRHPPVV